MNKTAVKANHWKSVGMLHKPDNKNRVPLTEALKHIEHSLDGFDVFINPLGEIKLVPIVRVPAYKATMK